MLFMWCANITASDYPEKALQVKKSGKTFFRLDQITFYTLSMQYSDQGVL